MRDPCRSKGKTLQVTLVNSTCMQIINTTREADVHLVSMMASFPVGRLFQFLYRILWVPPCFIVTTHTHLTWGSR